MSQDLIQARTPALFNSPVLTHLLWSPRSRKQIDNLVEILQHEPAFRKFDRFAHPAGRLANRRFSLSRQGLLLRALEGQNRLLELQKEHNWGRNALVTVFSLLDDTYPISLHYAAFILVIENQGTDEQIKEWIPLCERMEVLGTLSSCVG
jgi:acyl-CoA oxidase